MTITGYWVVRIAGGTPAPACGTSPTTPLPPTIVSCVDSGLADGAADYVVTAVVGTWTTSGTTDVPVTVAADRTAPTIRLSGAQRTNALIDRRDGESLLFFRPAAGGSIRIDARLTDEETGPESATFPAVTAAGWSHANETVTTGTGSPPTVTYRSADLAFEPGAATPDVMLVTGVDQRGNARTRQLTFVPDAQPPTGGALTVNGSDGDGSGTQSWDSDGAFTVSAVTPFVESESASAAGLADVVLTRESAALSDGTCSAFGGASDIGLVAPVEESGLSDGCYRYTLTGTDRVGNSAAISTTVRVDTTAPTGGALQANGVEAVPSGSVSITGSGSWSVTRTDFTDAGSGIQGSTLTRAQAALTAGACEAFGSPSTLSGSPGEASAATGCYRYVLTGLNGSGLTSELSTTVWVDRAAPTGGAMTVNGAAASGAGTSSTSTSDTVTVSTVTGFTDANAGIDTNEITRTFAPMVAGVCGTFDPASETAVSGTAPFTVSGLPDGCHLFTLTGIDLAGNSASISTTVRLDGSAPASGSLTVGGVPGTEAGSMAYARVNPVVVAWTKFADPESGMVTARVQRTTSTSLTNGVCGAPYAPATAVNLTTTLTPVTGTNNQSLSTSTLRCYLYVLTGTNSLGVTSTLQATVMFDSSSLTSTGRLTVNNSTTTTTPSTNRTGTYTVSTVRSFADAQSGIATNILTRTSAPVAASVCGTYDPATTVTLASPPVVPPVITESGMTPGCYRYTQTGTNAVGASITVSTFVRVDTTPPVGGALTVNGVDAAVQPHHVAGRRRVPDRPHGVQRSRDDDDEQHPDPHDGIADRWRVRHHLRQRHDHHRHAEPAGSRGCLLPVRAHRDEHARTRVIGLHDRRVRPVAVGWSVHRQRTRWQCGRQHLGDRRRRQLLRHVVHRIHRDAHGSREQHLHPDDGRLDRRRLRRLRQCDDGDAAELDPDAERTAERLLPLRPHRRELLRWHGIHHEHRPRRSVV